MDRFRKAAKALLDAVERNAAWAGAARDRADFAPRDVARVSGFLADEHAGGKVRGRCADGVAGSIPASCDTVSNLLVCMAGGRGCRSRYRYALVLHIWVLQLSCMSAAAAVFLEVTQPSFSHRPSPCFGQAPALNRDVLPT